MKKLTFLERSLAILSISISAQICSADTSGAAIYNPTDSFLTRKTIADPAAAAAANRLYYKKVVLDANYVVPADGSQASIDSAIAGFTLGQWKAKNGFSAAGAVTAGAKYYNGIDLGIGRNMTCVNQDGNAIANRVKGMACYVSSHGKLGGTMRDGLAALANNLPNTGTVAMEYRPDAIENKVRFFAFGAGGDSGTIYYAPSGTTAKAFYQFDTGAAKSAPGVCLACHGGTLSASTGIITKSHFLPLDIFAMDFANAAARKVAETQFNAINRWVYRGELLANPYTTPATAQMQIIDYLKGSYSPAPGTSPNSEIATTAVMNDDYVDARFAPAGSPTAITKAYNNVTKEFCRGCHLAANIAITPGALSYACDPSNDMAHSEVAAHNIYRHHEFVQPILNNIAAIASSTTCKSIFKLNDFEGLYPNQTTFFRVNNLMVAGSTTAALSPSIAKRTLQQPGSFMGAPIHPDAWEQQLSVPSQTLKSISFEYFIPTSQDEISVFSDVAGSVSINKDTINPGVVGTPFKVATIPFGDNVVGGMEVWIQSNRQLLAGDQRVEVDNFISQWSLNSSADIKQADFEDKTYGGFNAPTIAFVGPQVSECFNKRTNDRNQDLRLSLLPFEISQRAKLSDDSGRYALSTNGTLCAGETAKISFTLTGVPATNKVASLSFNYETFGGSFGKGISQLSYTTATGTVTKNFHELTQQGLDSNTGPAGGFVKIEVPVNTTFSITYAPSAGTAITPNTGLVLDNLSVITYNKN